MPRPPFTPIIEALPHRVPFIGPEAMERARVRHFRARLGANESIFGPSPRAVEVMRNAAPENWKYSDPENYELRFAIAAFHGVPMENVMVGEGIDGLLGLTCMLFLSPGDGVVTTEGAYPTFNFHVQAHGGKLHAIPMRSLREDLMGLLETAIKTRSRIIYVSNPNSPMGTCWTAAELQDRARACRSFGAWDRARARRWWHENGEKLRSGGLPALPTMTQLPTSRPPGTP